MEEKLKDQYFTLDGIINSTNALIFSVDHQYRYTSFNQGHETVMKIIYGAEIKIGFSILDYMTVPEDRVTARQSIDRALAGEQLVEEAYSGKELRSRKYFQVSHSPIRSEGTIIGVAVFAQDMTEHKKAEEALRESEERLRLTLDATNDGIWDWNVLTGSVIFSPCWYTMLGYEPDELPGTYSTWRSLLHPDDREGAEKKIQDHILNREMIYNAEFRMRMKQGAWCWISARGRVIERDEDGDPIRMVGTHTDITILKRTQEELTKKHDELVASYEELAATEEELQHNFEDLTKTELTLRKSEERLLMAQEIGKTGSWEYNLETGSIWGSAEGFRIYGYPPIAGDLPIDEIEACIPERERVHQALVDLISEGREYNLEFTINPVDSSDPRVIQSIAKLEKDPDDNPLKVVGVIQNITERKKAEDALRESEKRYRAVADFTYDWEFWIAPDGTFIYNSPSCERITGYRPEEFASDPDLMVSITHPGDRAMIIDHLSITGSIHREHDDLEYRIITKNGDIRWIDHECQPVFNFDREYLGRRGSNRDSTERIQVKKALQESEERFRILFEQATEAILVYDADLDRFTDANANAEQLFGCERTEFIKYAPLYFYPPNQQINIPVEDSIQDTINRVFNGETLLFDRGDPEYERRYSLL